MKALFPVISIVAVTACGMTACNKAPAQAVAPSQAQVAAFQAPPLPDPSRTDPAAVAMRQRYVDWNVAQVKAANAAAQKGLDQFYGQPAPKETYGRMAEGLSPKAG